MHAQLDTQDGIYTGLPVNPARLAEPWLHRKRPAVSDRGYSRQDGRRLPREYGVRRVVRLRYRKLIFFAGRGEPGVV